MTFPDIFLAPIKEFTSTLPVALSNSALRAQFLPTLLVTISTHFSLNFSTAI
jgi:hypothetical protein